MIDKQQDVIIFLGPPGAGKGSLSRLCTERLGWRQISTGNLLRYHMSQGTELGRAVKARVEAGHLVDDSLIAQLVHDWLQEPANLCQPIILDGFPRTAAQAQLFHDFIEQSGKGLRVSVLHLAVASEAIIERLEARIVCSEKQCQTVYSARPGSMLAPKKAGICDMCCGPVVRRADDDISVIRQRLEVYQQHEQELLQFMAAIKRPVISVPGDQELPSLFELVANRLGVEL